MLLFGHLGITLAATQTFAVLWQGKKRFSESIDYRLVLLGSMLPDIIDKPLGGFIFKDALGSGRIYAHTLIFLLLLQKMIFCEKSFHSILQRRKK